MTGLLATAKTAAYLTETAATLRADPDPVAQAAAGLLDAVVKTLTTAPPDVLYDYERTLTAALHLADTYNGATT